ncbi:MAG TPA: rRNA maturation RNase YbeY [Candidatus Paceibacterota bacterium]
MTGGTLDIRNMTRRSAPVFPFARARKAVLPRFDVSLAFVTPSEALALNKALRDKSYTPNVLSYRTGDKDDKSGEIIICLAEAQKQAPAFGLTYSQFVGFLFIHGLLHLEGTRHGPTMERTERKLFERVAGIPYPKNETPHRNGHRHRDPAGQDRRR